MPISSYVIRYGEGQREVVLGRLRGLSGVTVGEPTSDGIPVAADTRTAEEAEGMGELLREVPGVNSATLVYHNFEDLESEI